MSQLREPAFDRVVALVLRVGAFGCFFIMLAGLLVGLFVHGRISWGYRTRRRSADAGHASGSCDGRGSAFLA